MNLSEYLFYADFSFLFHPLAVQSSQLLQALESLYGTEKA